MMAPDSSAPLPRLLLQLLAAAALLADAAPAQLAAAPPPPPPPPAAGGNASFDPALIVANITAGERGTAAGHGLVRNEGARGQGGASL
jgi:hypothetical protein